MLLRLPDVHRRGPASIQKLSKTLSKPVRLKPEMGWLHRGLQLRRLNSKPFASAHAPFLDLAVLWHSPPHQWSLQPMTMSLAKPKPFVHMSVIESRNLAGTLPPSAMVRWTLFTGSVSLLPRSSAWSPPLLLRLKPILRSTLLLPPLPATSIGGFANLLRRGLR